jgi:hypothetical protein
MVSAQSVATTTNVTMLRRMAPQYANAQGLVSPMISESGSRLCSKSSLDKGGNEHADDHSIPLVR